MNKFYRNPWIGAAALLALAPVAVLRFRPAPREAGYETAGVTRGPLTLAVTATGQLNAVVKVQVGSQSSGIIEKLYVDYNDTVRKGQVIAQLDPATYQAAAGENEAALASAQDSLKLAQAQARRSRALHEAGCLSRADLDTANSALHQAETALKSKQAALARSRTDLARCTIYAPVDGVVISRNVEVGQTVAASLSAPTLFQIAGDLTRMQVDAKVSEADIAGVKPRQAVTFTVDAFPGRNFQGSVVQVRNEATTVNNVVTYDTVIQVANPDLALKPGMTAVVSIIQDRKASVLQVPNAALAFRPAGAPQPQGTVVHVLRSRAGGAPVPVAVAVVAGLSDGTRTEILSGLQEGDRVITGLRTQEAATPAKEARSPFEDKRSQQGPPGPPPMR